MTTFLRSHHGGRLSLIRSGALSLVLLAAVALAACAGLNSSTAVTSQGTGDAAVETPANAKNAILANLQGTVEVNSGDGNWVPAESGQKLQSGYQLRTGALSNVTVAYADGSQMYLGADAEIAIEALDARASGPRVVQLTQLRGESRHLVVRSDDAGSRYEIRTPFGNGSAADTAFTVLVLPDRFAQFWVESGLVSVESEDVSVDVTAGQTTINFIGQAPLEPMFRISGEGQVMQMEERTRGSSSRPLAVLIQENTPDGKITLCHATGSPTNPYIEITVSEQAAINGHANHTGDIIPAPAEGCPISAPINSSDISSWTIAGQTFHTGSNTIVFGDPRPGDWVSFEGRLQSDGTQIMDRLVLLNQNRENDFVFSGVVESIRETTWMVASREVQISENTTLDAGLTVGENVQVGGAVDEDGVFWPASIIRTDPAVSNFWFAGILTSMGDQVWVISGMSVTVDQDTELNGDFELGNPVMVEGVIQQDGTWLATMMSLVTPEDYRFMFTGVVQSLDPWTVSGVSFDTAEFTQIDANIELRDQVRVVGLVSADGLWVAEVIELLDTENETNFAFYGRVHSIDPWNVRGISVNVNESTTIARNIALGDLVKVSGRILEDGTWLATDIRHADWHDGQGCFVVTSTVQSIDGNQIVLMNGQTLVVDEDLVVTGDLQVGSVVRYQYCVGLDGEIRIYRIFVVTASDDIMPAEGDDGKVIICHYPPGNPENENTIEIGAPAVPAHLAHGDILGACPGD